ncbi:hypothetical protein C8R46DRAFT_1036191 [Mycena filopes]|nr:hypothetical protein C8R46DRAFT_1036191 [Mycena filopes]
MLLRQVFYFVYAVIALGAVGVAGDCGSPCSSPYAVCAQGSKCQTCMFIDGDNEKRCSECYLNSTTCRLQYPDMSRPTCKTRTGGFHYNYCGCNDGDCGKNLFCNQLRQSCTAGCGKDTDCSANYVCELSQGYPGTNVSQGAQATQTAQIPPGLRVTIREKQTCFSSYECFLSLDTTTIFCVNATSPDSVRAFILVQHSQSHRSQYCANCNPDPRAGTCMQFPAGPYAPPFICNPPKSPFV